jgi:hypothetical protein
MTRQTVEQFTQAIALAATLPDPADIYRAILAGSREVDDGLRATGHGGGHTSGGERSSHPERQLERRQPGQFPTNEKHEADPDAWEHKPGTWGQRTDRARDDMLALNKAATRVLDSIATLNAVCCDAGQPDTWAEAIHDANLLAETGMLQAALDVGRNVDADAIRFAHAVDTVRAIRDSWMAHQAPQSVAEANYVWCLSHARLNLEEKRSTRKLCRWCYRHVEDIAEFSDRTAVELQEDDTCWPSEAMIRAKEQGRPVLYDKEHQAWLRSHQIDPRIAHQRRQQRRSA